jgi:hypothetical protein
MHAPGAPYTMRQQCRASRGAFGCAEEHSHKTRNHAQHCATLFCWPLCLRHICWSVRVQHVAEIRPLWRAAVTRAACAMLPHLRCCMQGDKLQQTSTLPATLPTTCWSCCTPASRIQPAPVGPHCWASNAVRPYTPIALTTIPQSNCTHHRMLTNCIPPLTRTHACSCKQQARSIFLAAATSNADALPAEQHASPLHNAPCPC